ncbi:hypothetical protein LINPERPRIM_LOCUS28604 [Linum perenne]
MRLVLMWACVLLQEWKSVRLWKA